MSNKPGKLTCLQRSFKDVMAAMGLVPMAVLGLEASGVVIKTGSKAASLFQPGDPVIVFAEGCHATHVRCNYNAVAKIPNSMSFTEAASIPITHATAYHSLVNLARLRQGQSILIHAAAGGVGQAAIQLAKYLGLVVYATVGSDDKRDLLMKQYQVPESHIFHSRDDSFVKGIMRVTSGRGVDCVLNSLSGELLRASWGCLASFGKRQSDSAFFARDRIYKFTIFLFRGPGIDQGLWAQHCPLPGHGRRIAPL